MVQKSHGPRHRSRKKMTLKRKVTISKHLQKFEIGDMVHIDFIPNIKGRGYPYIRFKGKTGRIIGKRGNAYVITVKDKNMTKKVIAKAVHLKKSA